MKLSKLYRETDATTRRAILRKHTNLKRLESIATSLGITPSLLRDKLPERVLLGLHLEQVTPTEIMMAINLGHTPYGVPVLRDEELQTAQHDAMNYRYDDAFYDIANEESEMPTVSATSATTTTATIPSIGDIGAAIRILVASYTATEADKAKAMGLDIDREHKIDDFLHSRRLIDILEEQGLNSTHVEAVRSLELMQIDDLEKRADYFANIISMIDAKFVSTPDIDSIYLPIIKAHPELFDAGYETVSQIEAHSKPAEAEAEAEATTTPDIEVNPAMANLLDMALSQATGNKVAKFADVLEMIKHEATAKVTAQNQIKRLTERLRKATAPVGGKVGSPGTPAMHAPKSSEVWANFPTGEVAFKRAIDIFIGPGGKKARPLDFDVPTFTWDFDHPLVPTIDPNYQFKPGHLFQFLWALTTRRNTWLHGHTGTGKTTFVEQVAARLGWPFMRVNLDSEITRLDLIGRDVLSSEGGSTISRFVEGILPQAMQLQGMGALLCCDEISFGRPDVMYVFQRVLEDKGLLLNEDGGRLIPPGEWFRIVATDNTRGQGDELGAYAGARPQSAAFLDRFTCWIEFKYMDPKIEADLIQKIVPTLTAKDTTQIASFAFEVRKAFGNGEIFQTVSPRGTISFAEAFAFFNGVLGDRKAAVDLAADCCVLSKASIQDRQVIKGFYDRTFAS